MPVLRQEFQNTKRTFSIHVTEFLWPAECIRRGFFSPPQSFQAPAAHWPPARHFDKLEQTTDFRRWVRKGD
jgi:hypothetical protein